MKPKITLGVLIEATLRPIDTIPVMLREARRRELPWEKIIEDSNGQFEEENRVGTALLRDKFIPIPDAPYWNSVVGIDGSWTSDEDAIHTVGELIDLLNEDLVGCTFGVHPDDGACLGYWAALGDEDDAGDVFSWEPHNSNVLIRMKDSERAVLLQGDDSTQFLQETGKTNFIWDQDPQNTEGRFFKTREAHLDALAEPYFGND